ncbi:hypothetical protein 13VV501A_gene0014 [Vibrio phage 13VV501A]|nr:hypothetical protein 13VV501A_gene0014 [Vibrio phage 13VV501A]
MYEGIPTSAKDAKAAGHKYYFTGKPCTHGHITLRIARNQSCTECEELRKYRDGAKGRKALVKRTDARSIAIQRGDKRYHGKECPKCGNTEKYTSNKRCTTNSCQNPKMTFDEVKLLIIRRPHKSIRWYAARARRKVFTIYDAFQALNIPRSGKPPHYVG